MIVSLLVAMDENQGIGYENRLPWRLSSDLKHFKSVTMGHHLIMGRKTFESIGKPLQGRRIILLTRQKNYSAQGADVLHSLQEALELARSRGEDEVFIIGGGEVFKQSIVLADRIYLTQVHAIVPADVYFPQYAPEEWEEAVLSTTGIDEKNQFPTTIKLLTRKQKSPVFPP